MTLHKDASFDFGQQVSTSALQHYASKHSHTVSIASNVHLVHGGKIVHPVQARSCFLIKASKKYVYLIGFLHHTSFPVIELLDP